MVFIDYAVDAILAVIPIGSIHAVDPFDHMDIRRCTVFAVDADMAIGAISAIFAHRRNSNAILTVFTLNSNGTIDTIFTAHSHGISL